MSDLLEVLTKVEFHLTTGDFENLPVFTELRNDGFDQVLDFLFDCISNGDYNAILQKSLKFYNFPPLSNSADNVEDSISNFAYKTFDENPSSGTNEFVTFVVGISALQEFVRCNFCGPKHNVPEAYNLISELLPDSCISNASISQCLSLDGEVIYAHVIHPKLLYLSRCLFSAVENHNFCTLKWWLIRLTFLHQCILPEKNEVLHKSLVSLINEVYQIEWLLQENHASQKLVFAMEVCHIFLYYGEIKLARKYINDAIAIAGLEIELSGAVGKRTQHQQKPIAQLYVKLTRSHSKFKGFLPKRDEVCPADLQLKDDTLLNKIFFVDQEEQVLDTLYAEEQIVLLGYCCLVQKSGSFDELLEEEIVSYVNCLLSQPQVWSVYVKTLLLRCKAEKKRSRKIERAVTQLEAIVESVKNCTPTLCERQRFFYSTSFPPYWMIQKELADLLLLIGCTKSALDIYEKLELWEDIVECYIRLGRTCSAEKLIHEQLAKTETPFLWCLLGDVTENPDHYTKAWEISNNKSARAQRSLGYHHYRKKEYAKSIPPFLESLKLNNLQHQVWFSVGHAATQIEDFELAAKAYRQVVLFDDDQFEAWNNLANAYIKIKQKVRAWRSLNEALKCNYEEWRVWENFLLVSTDVGAFEDAIKAWHRLFDLKSKHNDSLLLDILVNAVVKDLPDINGIPSSRLKKKTLELLGRITSVITNDPKIWELYSVLSYSQSNDASQKDNLEKVILYLQKALRSYNQNKLWERNYQSCKEVLLCSEKLGKLSLEYISMLEGTFQNRQKMSTKLSLQAVVTRGSKNLSDFSDSQKDELMNLLDLLKNITNKILNL